MIPDLAGIVNRGFPAGLDGFGYTDRVAVIDQISRRLQALLRPRPAPPMELGWGGSLVTGGRVQDDHVAKLRGREAVRTAAQMRRSDAQVRALTSILALPIRSTSWSVEPPKDPGSAEQESAELLQANLFGGMAHPWDAVIQEAALAIWYGYRVPEIVWRESRGVIEVHKLAPRNPERLRQWCYDPNGRLVGYIYEGNRPSGDGLSIVQTVGQYEAVPIPLEKTVHYVYDRENDSPEGFGLWRSVYQPWYLKSTLYKVMSVGVERNLLDVPVGRMSAAAQPEDRRKMLELLRRWRAAEDAAVVLTDGQDIELKGSSRPVIDGMPLVNHLNQQILAAGLAQFLNLGQASVGTQALGEVQSRTYAQAADANARWIADTLTDQLIRRWCLLNYGPELRCPQLRWRPIDARDMAGLATTLTSLLSGGALHAFPEDEELLRRLLELPEIPREQLEQAVQEKREREAAAATAGAGSGRAGSETRRFAEVEAEREERRKAESRFAAEATEVLTGIQGDYLERLAPLVRDAGDLEKIAQGKPIDRLADVIVPGRARYRDFVRSYLWMILEQGRASLDATGPVSNRMRQWVTAKAELIADDHLAQMKTAVLGAVLTGIRAEMPAERILQAAEAGALDEWSRNIRVAWAEAAGEILAGLGPAGPKMLFYDPGQPRDEKGRWTARAGFRIATPDEMKARGMGPAFVRAEINEDPDAALQAVAYREDGSPRYFYSTAHQEAALAKKHERGRQFAEMLPALEERLREDMDSRDEAAILYLQRQTGFRVGGGETVVRDSQGKPAGTVPTYGASTLQVEHVQVAGDRVQFDFPGKGNIRQQHASDDPRLVTWFSRRLEARQEGPVFDADASRVRAYLAKIDGQFIPHDFRTWNATATARSLVSELPAPKSRRELTRQKNAVADAVARRLGDTRSTVLKSYIDPHVWQHWEKAVS
jgi:DNA topoisomerase-1